MRSPAFQFYPADFLADRNTTLMTAEEIGAYLLLLCFCWREGSLPNDMDDLAILARVTVDRFEKSWLKRISKCFEQQPDGSWIHPRLEEERAKQEEWARKSAEGGKKSAEKRAENRQKDPSTVVEPSFNGGSTVVQPNGNSSSSSSTSSSCTTNVVQREGPGLEAQTAVAAPAPQPKPKPKTQSLAPPTAKPNRDPALDNPATQIYRETFKRTPNEAQRAEIQKRVTDLNHYRATLANWQLSGWNPGNVLGQLDRYEQTKPKIEDQTLTVQQPECVALAPTGTGGMTHGQPIQRHQPKTFAELASAENARRLAGNAAIREQIKAGALQLPRIGKTG